MKDGAPNHEKMHKLADALGIKWPHAVGIMELLWHFTSKYHPRGDIGKSTDKHLAKVVGWHGKPSTLVSGLLTAGFVDPSDTSRLVVHDFPQHCNDSVHMALYRAGKRFADGTKPKPSRISVAEREELKALWERTESAQEALEKRTTEPSLTIPNPHAGAREAHSADGSTAPLAQAPGSCGSPPTDPPLIPSRTTQQTIEILAQRIEAHKYCETKGSPIRRQTITDRAGEFTIATVERGLNFINRAQRINEECKKLSATLARFPDGLNKDRMEQAIRLADEYATAHSPQAQPA